MMIILYCEPVGAGQVHYRSNKWTFKALMEHYLPFGKLANMPCNFSCVSGGIS